MSTDQERLNHLAKVVVRQGERINQAIEQWVTQREAAAPHSDKAELNGRIQAAMALSNGLRDDLESLMSISDVYVIAGKEVPEASLAGMSELDRTRRKLRITMAEAEMWQSKATELAERGGRDESQKSDSPGSDDTQSN
ncbi:MAG: hypothetical protein COA94_06020 [Rickettsiales bacterium]|nr:MAG: hypothetical protein COA94_06020 [Rickettsiales bacterium]